MKKLFTLFAVFALLLPVLSGCQRADLAADPSNTIEILQSSPSVSTAGTVPTATQSQLTRDDAINIALKNAGLTREQIQDLDVELDRDDVTLHYDVDFESVGYDYEYEIDANTGKILRSEKEKD